MDGSETDAEIVSYPNGTNYIRIRNALEMFQLDKAQYEYHGSVRTLFEKILTLKEIIKISIIF